MDLGQLARWNRRWLADGIWVVPPDGDGSLCIRTQQRPLRPLHGLLGDAAVTRFERFTTLEGEHAGLVDLGDPQGARYVAMIAGDESYALVEARTADRVRAAWFRDLAYTVARFFPLGLGRPRKRRYMYRPPVNWQPLARPGCVTWLAPEYPRQLARITVFDARPLAWYAPGAVDRFLFVDENPFAERDPMHATIELAARAGLSGPSTRVTGRGHDGVPLTVVKTMLQDGRYYYAVQLDAHTAEWNALAPTYRDVIASVEPVPESNVARSAQQFTHWIE